MSEQTPHWRDDPRNVEAMEFDRETWDHFGLVAEPHEAYHGHGFMLRPLGTGERRRTHVLFPVTVRVHETFRDTYRANEPRRKRYKADEGRWAA